MADTHLLDGNVLVALVVPEHVHHAAARSWFADGGAFATCPTVQGTLLRARLARARGGRVATLDRGFAVAAPDVTALVPH